jgi:hypothetical protein
MSSLDKLGVKELKVLLAIAVEPNYGCGISLSIPAPKIKGVNSKKGQPPLE